MNFWQNKNKKMGQSKAVPLFFFDIFHYVTWLTVQDLTQHINGMAADILVTAKPGKLPGTYVIFVYKHILCDAFTLHSFP